jgi:hypothetical protein
VEGNGGVKPKILLIGTQTYNQELISPTVRLFELVDLGGEESEGIAHLVRLILPTGMISDLGGDER